MLRFPYTACDLLSSEADLVIESFFPEKVVIEEDLELNVNPT